MWHVSSLILNFKIKQIYSLWHKRSWKDRPPPSPGASLSALTTVWVIARLREWMRTQAISSWQLHTGPTASASGRDKERERPRVHSTCWAVSLCPAVPLSTSLQPGWSLRNTSTKLLPSRSVELVQRGHQQETGSQEKKHLVFVPSAPSQQPCISLNRATVLWGSLPVCHSYRCLWILLAKLFPTGLSDLETVQVSQRC